MNKEYKPKFKFADEMHALKYRSKGESFHDSMARIAGTLARDDREFRLFFELLGEQRLLPAGRIQSAVGSPRGVTAFNCFVSGTIEDSMGSIILRLGEAAETMRLGGGIGYGFSNLRPRGEIIRSLDSNASGPVSFMKPYGAMCETIRSAGHRRGAQMGVLRIDHPDIEEFIGAKRVDSVLGMFNMSVAVTDEFMEAVANDSDFDLRWGGKVYKTVRARELWNKILRSTWEYAEPGVLFIDRINNKNNLRYCELIEATNPCGEQPLPPYGACLLASMNLTKYVHKSLNGYLFDHFRFMDDVRIAVRMIDRVIDNTTYPLPEQEVEAKKKRRMGLGITGLGDVLAALGYRYGSDKAVEFTNEVVKDLAVTAYHESIEIAKVEGSFPAFDAEKYLESDYMKGMPDYIRKGIETYGIRNSHLTSIAPTGTISLCADGISSGVEPIYAKKTRRIYHTFDTKEEIVLGPYCQEVWGINDFPYVETVAGEITPEHRRVSVDDHVRMLCAASRWIDSSVSKTVNVGPEVTWEEFKDVYWKAYEGGASGITTYRDNGRYESVIKAVSDSEAKACTFDPETGIRTCDE